MTARSYHGTALQAIEWAIEHEKDDIHAFLRSWQHGDLDDWPEFYEWLDMQLAPMPDDIVRTAQLTVSLMPNRPPFRLELVDIIARAIMTERGRCAVFGTVDHDSTSLRDYFAGQALSGLLKKDLYAMHDHYAERAYVIAEAMLTERDHVISKLVADGIAPIDDMSAVERNQPGHSGLDLAEDGSDCTIHHVQPATGRREEPWEKQRRRMIADLKAIEMWPIEITCDDCSQKIYCPYSFDLYNTQDDCLAEK